MSGVYANCLGLGARGRHAPDVGQRFGGLRRVPASARGGDRAPRRPVWMARVFDAHRDPASSLPADRAVLDFYVLLGRGQAVRRGTLDPVFEGSNPSAPTIRKTSNCEFHTSN